MPVQPPGVPTPYAVHVHPYPTRYHGGQWVRPVFGLPRVQSVSSVFQPNQMQPSPGSGELFAPVSGLGSPDGLGDCTRWRGGGPAYVTHAGVFRRPRSGGGGVFNRAISNAEPAAPAAEAGVPLWAYFLAGGAVAFVGAMFLLEDRGHR